MSSSIESEQSPETASNLRKRLEDELKEVRASLEKLDRFLSALSMADEFSVNYERQQEMGLQERKRVELVAKEQEILEKLEKFQVQDIT